MLHNVNLFTFMAINSSVLSMECHFTATNFHVSLACLIRYEPRHEKMCLREFPTRSDSNWPVQLQKLA